MKFEFEVKRKRMSVTQGEAAVYCNGTKIVQYGDTIELNSEGKWESVVTDQIFVAAAMRQYTDKILKCGEFTENEIRTEQLNKYEILTRDLREAKIIAIEECKDIEDTGIPNYESLFITLTNYNQNDVIKAVERAGLYCSNKMLWDGEGFIVNVLSGQASKRIAILDVFQQILLQKGYRVKKYSKKLD